MTNKEIYSYHQIPKVRILGSRIDPRVHKMMFGTGLSPLRHKTHNSILRTLKSIPELHAGIDHGP